MKKIFLAISLFAAAPAVAGPFTKMQCEPVSNGIYRVDLRLAKGYDFGRLVLKNPENDFARDLTRHPDNRFSVEIASQTGLTGYALDYRLSGVGEYVTYSGEFNCDEHGKRKKNQTDAEGDLASANTSVKGHDLRSFNALNDLDHEEIYDVDEQVSLDY